MLWVSWTKTYLLREKSFWDISDSTTHDSWMWRKLLKLHTLAARFIKIEIYGRLGVL
ncbi:hypothetical protein YC2023_010473 [Brassica napus]